MNVLINDRPAVSVKGGWFFLGLIFAACPLLAADDSDLVMPEVVKRADVRVEVLMRHSPTTGECFPDRSAAVRFINGAVRLTDFAHYPHMTARLSEGLVAFQMGGKWGACDKDGKVVIPPCFEKDFFWFSYGLAGVCEGGRYGFIDKQGNWVIKPKFDTNARWEFIADVCPVKLEGRNAVIDRQGRYIWEPGLRAAEVLGGGICIHTKDGRSGFLDDQGAVIPNGEPNRNHFKE